MTHRIDKTNGVTPQPLPLTERTVLSEFLNTVGETVEAMRQQQVDQILGDPIPHASDIAKLDFATDARIETTALTEAVRVTVSVEFTSEAELKEDVVRAALSEATDG